MLDARLVVRPDCICHTEACNGPLSGAFARFRRHGFQIMVCAFRHLILISTVLTACGLAGAQSSPSVVLNNTDFACPDGLRLMSPDYARTHQNEVCNLLDDWDTARLSGGASLGGAGHNCVIQDINRSALGLSVCLPAEDLSYIRGLLLFEGLRTPQELTAMSPDSWRGALVTELGNRIAESDGFYDGLGNDDLAAFAGLVLYLQKAKRSDPLFLSEADARDIRQNVRIEVNEQTGIPLTDLIRLSDQELLLILTRG